MPSDVLSMGESLKYVLPPASRGFMFRLFKGDDGQKTGVEFAHVPGVPDLRVVNDVETDSRLEQRIVEDDSAQDVDVHTLYNKAWESLFIVFPRTPEDPTETAQTLGSWYWSNNRESCDCPEQRKEHILSRYSSITTATRINQHELPVYRWTRSPTQTNVISLGYLRSLLHLSPVPLLVVARQGRRIDTSEELHMVVFPQLDDIVSDPSLFLSYVVIHAFASLLSTAAPLAVTSTYFAPDSRSISIVGIPLGCTGTSGIYTTARRRIHENTAGYVAGNPAAVEDLLRCWN